LRLNSKAVTIATNTGMKMDAKGFVVPPGGGSVLRMAPGRSAALKLQGGETGNSIMLFEETAPAGTDTTFHLHRDSDEVAYVLSGEITFKIGDEIAVGGPGTCAFIPRRVPHAWKNTGAETGRCCSSTPRPGPVGFRGTVGAAGRVGEWTRSQRNSAPARLGGWRTGDRTCRSSILALSSSPT
jgi:mannose-6-phosphate isomerase-like protein (cupin superfamily)